jgi:hypothetical protein
MGLLHNIQKILPLIIKTNEKAKSGKFFWEFFKFFWYQGPFKGSEHFIVSLPALKIRLGGRISCLGILRGQSNPKVTRKKNKKLEKSSPHPLTNFNPVSIF